MLISDLAMNVDEPLVQASLVGEAIDEGPVLVLVADEMMRYVAVNQYAADVLGYTRAELLKLRVTDVAPEPETADRFADFVAHRKGEGTSVIVRKDGTPLKIAYRARETRVAGMTLYVSVAWVVG